MNPKLILLATLFFVLVCSALVAQVTTPNNNSALGVQYVGWNGTTLFPKSVDVKNFFANQNINFFTNNTAANGSSIQRMTIIGSAGPTAGFVGIGLAAPAYQLNVE